MTPMQLPNLAQVQYLRRQRIISCSRRRSTRRPVLLSLDVRLLTQTTAATKADRWQRFATPPRLCPACCPGLRADTGELKLLEPSAGTGMFRGLGGQVGSRLALNEIRRSAATVLMPCSRLPEWPVATLS